MHEIVAVADHRLGTADQTIKSAFSLLDGHDAKPTAIALDLDRLARLEHLVEDAIDVLAQFGGGEGHVPRLERT